MFETTLRYNSLNNKHAVEGETTRFDSLLIDAKMLAYSSKALPQFIHELRNDKSVDYYIDPIISDFRAGDDFRYSDGTLRGWYDSYVDELGDPLKQHLRSHPTANPRRMDEKKIQEISKSVVRFQEDFVSQQIQDEGGKYTDISAEELSQVQPRAVIPWHHRVNEIEDLGPNRTILETSVETAEVPVKPCIHTTKTFIRDVTNRNALIEFLSGYEVEECFVLIENLDKHETFESNYVDVIDLIYDISESGVRPHFYYGDFFSNLLAYFGLGGTAYGVMYGEEYRETTEHTGQGGMLMRYYVDQIKDFLKVPAAVELMKRTETNLCDCDVCQRQFDSWDDIIELQESDDNLMNPLQKHYVECRWRHARSVEETPFDEMVEKQDSVFQEYVNAYNTARQISPSKDFDYLPRWISAIETRSELAEDNAETAILRQ